MAELIPQEAFERVLQQAIVRPAGRSFRGEPARQVELIRFLRQSGRACDTDAIFGHLRDRGALRTERDDDASRRKVVSQAVEAINVKLGSFFFLARDPRLLEEMFRIEVVPGDAGRPLYRLQDFFETRKISGVRSYASTADPAGGLTRELYEIVTELRPRRLDLMAPSFEPFFGNAEFRALMAGALLHDDARVRMLLLDPDSREAERLEAEELREAPVLGPLRERIRATIASASALAASLPPAARPRLQIRLAGTAPLWRFRMIFLPEVLHLRLSTPAGPSRTLIKLAAGSALHASLHDVFSRQWNGGADPARSGDL